MKVLNTSVLPEGDGDSKGQWWSWRSHDQYLGKEQKYGFNCEALTIRDEVLLPGFEERFEIALAEPSSPRRSIISKKIGPIGCRVNRRSKIDRNTPHSIEILPDRGDASYAVSDGGSVRLHAPDVPAMIPTVTLETEICGARNGIGFFARTARLVQAPRRQQP